MGCGRKTNCTVAERVKNRDLSDLDFGFSSAGGWSDKNCQLLFIVTWFCLFYWGKVVKSPKN